MAQRGGAALFGAAMALLGAASVAPLLVAPALAEPASAVRAAAPAGAPAGAPITARFGNHRDFGRVVFDLPPGARWRSARSGQTLTIRLDGGLEVAPPDEGAARNVEGFSRIPHGAELVVAQGARTRAWRLGNRLVVDVFDPPAPGRAERPTAAAMRAPAAAPLPIPPAAPPGAPPDTPPGASPPVAAPLAAAAEPAQRRPPELPPAASLPAASSPAPLAAAPAIPAPAVPATTPAGAPEPPPPVAAATARPVAPHAPASPPAASPTPAAASPTPPKALAATPVAEAPVSGGRATTRPVTAPVAAPAALPVATMALAARPAPAPGGGHALTLPFPPGTAAAAFRLGGDAIVVFDTQRPIDLAPARSDPAFGTAAITLLPAATVLRLPLAQGQALSLAQTANAWTVTVGGPTGGPTGGVTPIRPVLQPDRLLLPIANPGQVVSLPDPQTGATLLVGTASGAGPAMLLARRASQFTLRPSWQGVVVQPVSDAVRLDRTRDGFALTVEGGAGAGSELALSAPDGFTAPAAAASALSRRFDLPALPLPGLMHRLQAAVDAAAAAPLQARGPKRVAVAEALLALGMAAEAGSVLQLAGADDGRLADDPTRIGLAGVAAILTDANAADRRLAGGIDDPRLDGSDEVALWRALRDAKAGRAAQAAPALAATWKLLPAYPEPLAARLLPLAAETLAEAGEAKAATALLATRPHDRSLLLARAMVAERGGDAAAALRFYDEAAAGSDRRMRARAAFRAIEVRVARGMLTPAAAADALDRQILAWRGDGHELAVRRREAELRAEAGEPRRALALLRETVGLFPAEQPALHAEMGRIFTAALDAGREPPLSPLQLVALAGENPDLVPSGEAGRELASRLADRLMALQLPGRALPVLEKLVDNTPPGDARATLGARLAEARMAEGDARGALASLAATRSVGEMAPDLLERRTLLFARASAATGELAQASAALAALGTPAADEARASLLEQAKDWPGARDALLAWTARVVAASGPLDAKAAAALLRLAAAAAQTGDEALLAKLREHDLPRLPPGQLADMLRLLTAGPVDRVADLGRAAQETRLASQIPAALKSLSSIANP